MKKIKSFFKFSSIKKLEYKKRCERGLLLGTSITLIGVICLYWFRIDFIISGIILFCGKILVLFSLMGYAKYNKLIKGKDVDYSLRNIQKIINKVK